MARATSVTTTKDKMSKGAIAKLAEETAKKTIKKETGKIARKEATKVAAKVATEAALNPDYELNDDEEFTATSGYASWEDDEDEDEDEDTGSTGSGGLFRSFSSRSNDYSDDSDDDNDDDAVDLSRDVKSRDIFAYSNDLMNKGTPVRLQIKKNGQFLTTIKKPYSEEQLQKDYGEGHYAVILRNDIKGTFIKQQSFSIAAPPQVQQQEVVKLQQEKQEEKIDKMFQTFSQMQASQSDTQQQLFERLMEEQRRREDEEKERRKEERELMKYNEQSNTSVLATVLQAALSNKGDDNNLSAILQVMQSQQSQTTQMIMESNKNFMMMIQEMRRDTQSMMEKMTQMSQEQAREFRMQLSEMNNSGKGDNFDAIEMFKMLNDTRESGMNFGLKINELAKQIAETDIKPVQPKGIVESVMDNIGKFAPIMLSAAQAQAQQPPQPQTYAAPPTSQGFQPVPVAPNFKKPETKSNAPIRPATPNPAPVNKAPGATPRPQVIAVPKSGVVHPTTTQPNFINAVQSSSATKPQVAPKQVAQNPETAKIIQGTGLKDKAIDICVPLIAQALGSGETFERLGEATLNAFKNRALDPVSAVKAFTVEDIYTIAFTKYKLPDMPELRQYLKDYHDYLLRQTSTQESGETPRPTT